MSMNREQLVRKHNPVIAEVDIENVLTVGNGGCAYNVDCTGMQSLSEHYTRIPLCTMSQWCWHSDRSRGQDGSAFTWHDFRVGDRTVPYAYLGSAVFFDLTRIDEPDARREAAGAWLAQNPQRVHMGQIGLCLLEGDSVAQLPLPTAVHQELDLWTGVITSRFTINASQINVTTCFHPEVDQLAVCIESPLAQKGRLAVRVAFPYASPDPVSADWSRASDHSTQVVKLAEGELSLVRRMGTDEYGVGASVKGGRWIRADEHTFVVKPNDGRLELCVRFAPRPEAPAVGSGAASSQADGFGAASFSAASFQAVREASENHWRRFWTDGAAVAFGGRSTESQAQAGELERRAVLSQYLTAVQCSGSLPPQETGLTMNSWAGKFHLEMHWWHAAHFPAWGRPELLARSLDFYKRILPRARATAKRQGYPGARWPKQTGSDGEESPSSIGPMLIWQQPHPIYYAELLYRSKPAPETLESLAELVYESAEFMAGYAAAGADGLYHLGPPMIPAQEVFDPLTTFDPAFELEYWAFGLELAIGWMRRMGKGAPALWNAVRERIAKPHAAGGTYEAHAACSDTFTRYTFDHPSFLGALGVLPGGIVESSTMGRTLDRSIAEWEWDRSWGWDYPLAAMTAARLNRPNDVLKLLLLDAAKNHYSTSGHVFQFEKLPLYLPANGGFLAALALALAGWHYPHAAPGPGLGAEIEVQAEGLEKML